jgi:pimeloyl-ACP methyl ester carboxylesterase
MAAVEHRFVEVAGVRLHVLDFGGRGLPVVLLHGVGGTAWIWHDVAARLTRARRPLALDFRGYGESQWAPRGDYSTDGHADDVTGVLAALGIEEADIVGFSWGGLVGIALSAGSPLVRRLAVVDIAPSSRLGEHDVAPLPYAFASHAEAVEGERTLSPRASEPTLELLAAHTTRPTEGGRLVRKLDPVLLDRWPFRRDDRWAELRSLHQPVLVVHAEQSAVLSAEDAERMVDTLPDGRLVTIPDCGHLAPTERPEELASALEEFLAA